MDPTGFQVGCKYNQSGTCDPGQSQAAAFRPSGPPISAGPPRKQPSDLQPMAGATPHASPPKPAFAPGFGAGSAPGGSQGIALRGPPGYKGRLPGTSASSAPVKGSALAAPSPQGPSTTISTSGPQHGDAARVHNPPKSYAGYPPGMVPLLASDLHSTSAPQASSNGTTGAASSLFAGQPGSSPGAPSYAPTRTSPRPPTNAQSGQPSTYLPPSDPHLGSSLASSGNDLPSFSISGPQPSGLPFSDTAPYQRAGPPPATYAVPVQSGGPRVAGASDGFLFNTHAARKGDATQEMRAQPFGFPTSVSPPPDDPELELAFVIKSPSVHQGNGVTTPSRLGYDAKFEPPLSPEYTCTICNNTLRDPVRVQCQHQHRFCKLCIEALLMSGMPCCPEDFTPISKAEIVADEQCHKEILSRTVLCDEAYIGCNWRGCLQNLQDHLDTDCEFQLRPCPNAGHGCKKRLQQRNMDDHIASSCLFVSVQCRQCAASVLRAHYEEHLSACPEVEQQCPSGCGTMLLGKQMELHVSERCPLSKEECQYESYGCNAKVHRSRYEEHMQSDAHHHVDLLRTAVESERREKDSLRREVSSLRDVVQGLERQLASCTLLQEETLQATVERMCREMMNQHTTSVHEDMARLEQSVQSQEGAVQREYVDSYVDNLKGVVRETQLCSERLEENIGQMAGQIATMREESSSLASLSDATELMLNSLDIRLLSLETTSYSGIYVWKIPDYSRRADDAMTAQKKSLLSPPFYTSRHGYKMCARLYPHGDGQGKKSHISVFFVLMRGEYDSLLSWPFRQKVTLTLLDQSPSSGKHISDTFKPDPDSSSFEQPKSEMNVASGCPRFVPLETVKYGREYIKDDVMYIRIAVNTADLQNRY